MDAVELPLPAAIVTKIMRSSGCSGGSVATRVDLLESQSERETCSTSFHPEKDGSCNINGSKPAFWNKMSDEDLYKQASQLSGLCNEEAFVNHDMASVSEAKQLQRKSGKAARSNGNSSRKSRIAHMAASLNLTVPDVNDLPKELGSYPGKYNIGEKIPTAKQKTSVSGKRSDKRNSRVNKSKCDSFSVKAGLSSFSSAAGGNNILGMYAPKHDICDFEKHVDELALNELLDGSYTSPKSIKDKENKTGISNGSVLQSVREACSILQLQKPSQTLNVAVADGTYNHDASTNDDNKGDAADSSSCNKDHHTNILQLPLSTPREVLDRLALPPPKDLDLLLLESAKPTSTSKVQDGGSLPTFPWSHASGGHFKSNPDAVKSTPSKSACQGRWVRMGNSTAFVGDTTTYLADFESLAYNQSLVPVESQRPGLTEKGNSPLPSPNDTTASRTPGVLAAAQTLCDIHAEFQKLDQHAILKSQKKSSKKSFQATKLTSDEELEKALFTIPTSKLVSPITDTTKTHTPKKPRLSINSKSNDFSKEKYHWPTSTPQSSRSSFKNPFSEAKHHESSSTIKRSVTSPPASLLNKPPKLRKLLPMDWKSRNDHKGNTKY